jgi:uncharacterized repeat protein (TIGR03806 family)
MLASACNTPRDEPVPIDDTPRLLSAWHLLGAADDRLTLRADALPYDLNTPLFTDYAHKLRTVWVPEGTSAVPVDDRLEFPVGTVFTKTFYYPERNGVLLKTDPGDEIVAGELDLRKVRLVETRILVRRPDGWEALPYVWNDDQTDATLKIGGDIKQLALAKVGEFSYVVPNKNECASCHASNHTDGEVLPIGPKPRHLDKIYVHYAEGSADQLSIWQSRNIVQSLERSLIAANAAWVPGAKDNLEYRARSYLDINCGHCHSPVGPADTSGLFLDISESSERRLGLCKPPIAAGKGSGGRSVSIWPGDPDRSILTFRMGSRDPSAMMPEIGRSLVHTEGVELIEAWIASMPGNCG